MSEALLDGFVIGAIAALIGAIIDLVVTNMNIQDSLDTKSGWREKLFEVAAKERISMEDVQVLRATLRFTPKKKTRSIMSSVLTSIGNLVVKSVVSLLIFLLIYKYVAGKLIPRLLDYVWKLTFHQPDNELLVQRIFTVIASCVILFIFEVILTTARNTKFMEWELFNRICGLRDTKVLNGDDYPSEKRHYNFDDMTATIIDFCDSITSGKINIYCNLTQQKLRIYTRYMLKHHWEELSVPNYRVLKKIQVRLNDEKNIEETMSLINEIGKEFK